MCPSVGWEHPVLSPHARSAWQDPARTSMPAYFRFLTIMAFHVFLQEKVGGGGHRLVVGTSGWQGPQGRRGDMGLPSGCT